MTDIDRRTDDRDSNRVLIFDTTLRDGEQSPGATMTHDEKLEIAQHARRDGRRHHRGRLPDRLRGRLPRRLRDREGGEERGDLRPRPRQPQGHRPLLGGGAPREIPAHPHLHRHLAAAPRDPEPDHGRDGRADPRDGDPRPQPLRQRAMVADGRDADRVGLPRPRRRDRDQGRRHDDQHPRHRGLHRAGRERRPDPPPDRRGAGRGRGDLRDALPQRPRHGDGQQPRRRRGRRAADRVHDQRPGRACRQHRAGRGGDGAEGAPRHHALDHPASTPPRSWPSRAASPPSRASRCSSTRRSSARTPSRTRAASTRTACSRTPRRSRSCAPRMSACPPPRW